MNRPSVYFLSTFLFILALLSGCEKASGIDSSNTGNNRSGDNATDDQPADTGSSRNTDNSNDSGTDESPDIDTADDPTVEPDDDSEDDLDTDTDREPFDSNEFWHYTDTDTNTDDDTEPVKIIEELPEGFSPATPDDTDSSYGGFVVVGPLDENVVHDDDAVCKNIIRVVVRDFVSEHGDFQDDWTTSAVEVQLGDDQKPVAGEGNTSQIETEWYHNLSEVNMSFAVDLWLEPVGDTFVFDSSNFFPIDGYGFDETCICGDYIHNFHFTTEMHAKFEYHGGEEFTFIGDDDVYVFINNQLVVDLGGVHIPETGSVILDEVADELSLKLGEVYPIDLFQAERQTCGSNFRIETTLDFSGCGVILPGDIIVE